MNSGTVIAFDPGETTGIVVAQIDGNDIGAIDRAQEIVWNDRFSILPLLGITRNDPPFGPIQGVIVESFNLYASRARSQIGSYFPSVRVIGIIETACHIHSLTHRLEFIPPSSKKMVKLMHDLPASDHVRDAYKLARYFVVTRTERVKS